VARFVFARRLLRTRGLGWRWDRTPVIAVVLSATAGVMAQPMLLATPAQAATPTVVSDPGWMPNVDSQIGATQLWKSGATGAGVGVALIDTGVAPVNGLTSGNMYAGPDLSTTAGVDGMYGLDAYGHGTFLAGIIAGRDDTVAPGSAASVNSSSGSYLGVAPDASLVSVKVGGPDGSVDPSQVIAALDWVAAHHADPGVNIRVVNLSYGTESTQSYRTDPLAAAVERVWKSGVVVTVAAGNDGQQQALLNDPAIDPYVIAVGANGTYGSDGKSFYVTTFTNSGNSGRHVDLVAPGTSIVSLRDPGSYVDVFNPQGMLPVENSDRYFRGSGTSEASAVVSGVVALLLQKYPSLSPDMVKNILMASASPLYGATAGMVGAGSVNASAASTLAAAVVQGGDKLPIPPGPTGQPLRNLPDHGGAQTYPASDGSGSLDATRAGSTIAVGGDSKTGTALTGEDTVFGVAYNGDSVALDAASWGGGTWTGRAWSGRAWSGRAWSGQAWQGDAWSGRAWSGDTWDGRAWSGRAWSSDQWSAATWSSTDWSGRAWSGNNWGQPQSQVSFGGMNGVAVDDSGNVWIADTGNNQVDEFNADGIQLKILTAANSVNLNKPMGVAIDGTGNVYVADAGNNRVVKFSPAGQYVSSLTTSGLVTNGKPVLMRGPQGVAADKDGNVYVADTGNNRVEKFDSTGAFGLAFTVSGLGMNNGKLNQPQGVAVDKDGNVFVADTGNNEIEQFTPAGTLSTAWNSNGNAMLKNGSMNKPRGIAVDKHGTVFVADTGNDQVELLAAQNGHESVWTTVGFGPLSAPTAIAVDAQGNAYIANSGTLQVQVAGPNGVLRATFGAGSQAASTVNKPQGVALDSDGTLWVADTNNNQIVVSRGTNIYLTAIRSNGVVGGSLKAPEDLAFGPDDTMWIADTGNNRVEHFTRNGEFLNAITTTGLTSGKTTLNAPAAVAVDARGNVYIADTGNNRVEEFDASGSFQTAFTSNGTASGSNATLSGPSGVAVDATGDLFIADSGHSRVVEFGPDGSLVAAFDNSGTPASLFMKNPSGVSIDSNGDLWVSDTGNNQLEQINLQTDAVTGWTNNANGAGAGRMSAPADAVVDAAGNVFVADTGNSQVDQFSKNNVVLSTIGANNGLNKAQAMARDSKGNLYVADTGNNRVVEFAADGSFLRSFNFSGPGTSSGLMKNPSGVGVDGAGNVWVADTGNNQIERFTPRGGFVQAIAATGLTTKTKFNAPSSIQFDAVGNLWVVDSGNGFIEEFNSNDALIKSITWGGQYDSNHNPLALKKPSAVAFDSAGNIFVSETGNDRIVQYTADGTYVRGFTPSVGGGLSFSQPQGLYIDTTNNIYVTDGGNNQVEEFTLPSKGNPKVAQTFTAAAPQVDGTPTVLNHPMGLFLDTNGQLVVADTGHNRFSDLQGNLVAPLS